MRTQTKQELRNEISELKCELFRSICELPDGQLKTKLSERYPDYCKIKLIDKYATISFLDVRDEINKHPINNTGKFYYFEKGISGNDANTPK